ncbi:MAG: sulfatase-like hydrolase/transferase [Planctomycetes bacterium]|nr:sulfatase-like hydrolase/transferase [Planctomycetota bacterium]
MGHSIRPHLLHKLATLIIVAISHPCCICHVFADNLADSARRPNIVLILADDLGYGDLSLLGNRQLATPRIDRLAAEGAHCTNGYASCPYCSPTRAGLLTSRYQQRFGHEFNPALLKHNGAGQGLPVGEATFFGALQAVGYATSLIGKWHEGEEAPFHPLARGFGEFYGFLTGAHTFLKTDDPNFGPILRGRQRVELDGYLTDVLAREACDFVERHRAEPFALYLAFNAVHTPMEAPSEAEAALANITDPTRRTYLAMLAKLDVAVGAVLDKLKATGLDERTLVFFISDNGGPTTKFSPNGSTNALLRGSKGDTWEGGIRVPFLVRWPGRVPAGARFDAPVIVLDIGATALAAANVKPAGDKPLDGVDLLPHLTGAAKQPPHEHLYWRFGKQMAVRSGNWKLVRPSLGPGEYQDVSQEPLLFNLFDDLGEQTNLAAKHPDRVAQLQAAWDQWNAQMLPPRWPATVKGKRIEP